MGHRIGGSLLLTPPLSPLRDRIYFSSVAASYKEKPPLGLCLCVLISQVQQVPFSLLFDEYVGPALRRSFPRLSFMGGEERSELARQSHDDSRRKADVGRGFTRDPLV